MENRKNSDKKTGIAKKRIAALGAGVVLLLAAAYVGLWWYVKIQVDRETRRLAIQSPWIEKIQWNGLRLSPLTPRFVLKNVELYTIFSDSPFFIGAIKVYVHEVSGNALTRIHYSLEPVRFKTKALGPAGRELAGLGYEEINGALTLACEMNPASGRIRLSALDIKVDRAWESRMSVDLKNLDLTALLSPNPNPLSLLGVQIVSARPSFRDLGLMDRAIEKMAEKGKTEPEKSAEILSGNIRTLAQTRPEPEAKALINAFSRFCLPPHSMSIALDPPEPVAFSRFVFSPDPFTWIKPLGITAISPIP